MNQRRSSIDAFFRFLTGAYLFVLVLAMYSGTDDPTIHVKDLITAWGAGLIAGAYLVIHWITGIPLRRPAIFLETVLCLLGFFLLSTVFSPFFRYSLLETGQFFSLFALYWVASQVYTRPEHAFRLFAVFCAAVFLAGLYAVAQKAGIDPFPWDSRDSDTYTNLPATFGNPNYAAHAIILALIFLVCLVRSGLTWAGWILAPVLIFHLVSTGQRAGWIALAAAALLTGLAWLLLPRSRRPLLAVTGTIMVVAIAGVAAVSAAVLYTHARTGQYFPLDLSLLLRYQSYVSATKMLFDAPLIGHGPAVYGLAYAPYWTPYEQAWFAQELLANEHVHNDLLELAIDGGLAAAGLYLTILVLGIGYGLLLVTEGRSSAYQRAGYTLAAFFAAFAVDGLFGFNLRVPVTAALFFVMMGVLDGLWNNEPERVDTVRPKARGHALRAAFLLLLVLSTWQETRRFASEVFSYQGVQARAEGNLDAAETAYTKAKAYAGWNWEIPGYLGLLELDRKQPEKALAHFSEALALNPHAILIRLPAARANLMLAQGASGADGSFEAATGFLEAARREAQTALETAPGLPAANDLLGRIEAMAAILERDRVANPDPDAVSARWRAARDYFNAAIDGGGESPEEVYRMLTQVEQALGNLEGAERAMAAALRLDPLEPRTWKSFFTFARNHQRFDTFRDQIYRLIDHLQGDGAPAETERAQLAEAYGWLAVVAEEGFQDSVGAGLALENAVLHGPGRADLWNRFQVFAEKNQQLDTFHAALTKACDAQRARGETPLPQVEAVDLALRDHAGNLDAASRTLLAAVRSFPDQGSLSIKLLYGWAATELQRIYDVLAQEGTAPCESALNLGIVAASLDGLNIAAPLFERAHACLEGEQRAAAAVHWSDTLMRQGKVEEAVQLLRQSESAFPNHMDTQWALARALARGGNLPDARALYQRLIETPDLAAPVKAQLESELGKLPT